MGNGVGEGVVIGVGVGLGVKEFNGVGVGVGVGSVVSPQSLTVKETVLLKLPAVAVLVQAPGSVQGALRSLQ